MKVNIIEFWPNRARYIEDLIHKTGTDVSIEVFPLYEQPKFPTNVKRDKVILSGGSLGINEENKYPFIRPSMEYLVEELVMKDISSLGICFGYQLLIKSLGGIVQTLPELSEHGFSEIILNEEGKKDKLFNGLPNNFFQFQYHNDSAISIPSYFTRLATNNKHLVEAVKFNNIYGLQFHPEGNLDVATLCEVPHTNYDENSSIKIMKNFLEL